MTLLGQMKVYMCGALGTWDTMNGTNHAVHSVVEVLIISMCHTDERSD